MRLNICSGMSQNKKLVGEIAMQLSSTWLAIPHKESISEAKLNLLHCYVSNLFYHKPQAQTPSYTIISYPKAPDRSTQFLIKCKEKHKTHWARLSQACPAGLRKKLSNAMEVWVCGCQSSEPLYRAKTKSCSVPAQQWRQPWDSLYLFYRAISQLFRATPMQGLKKRRTTSEPKWLKN